MDDPPPRYFLLDTCPSSAGGMPLGRHSASLASEKGCQRTYDKKKKIKSCRLLNFISLVTITKFGRTLFGRTLSEEEHIFHFHPCSLRKIARMNECRNQRERGLEKG